MRGRNADWAEAAVRGARESVRHDALEQHVIEIIAKDVPDLLQQLQGRKVKAATAIVLDTKGSPSSGSLRTGARVCCWY